ncbi:1-deoxy-D-xylulose-5-phosphate reductoisomerase [Candidatus Dependentiae bacterium]|nr:1-deoxy-D-xylulose-5-phosphate reductoisomerase [Candidatus Dependentiae bacterium]
MKKSIVILGSTGSIGVNTLEVLKTYPDRFEIKCLIANTNWKLLKEQADEFKVKTVGMFTPSSAVVLKQNIGEDVTVLNGESEILDYLNEPVDIVVSALVGCAGLKPTYRAIDSGSNVCIANKESIVVGGELILPLVNRKGIKFVPIDSEHSAMFQILNKFGKLNIKRAIITASGGPFFRREDLSEIKVTDALNHPTWDMGAKITIDSATLMNKGFEVIEAHWLFGLDYDKIEVLVHPQSMVHSMVEYKDGGIVAMISPTDMKFPITYSLFYPEDMEIPFQTLDFSQIETLNFYPPDLKKFPLLNLAYKAGKSGGSYPAVLTGANDVAVELFLKEKISFIQISEIIKKVLDKHKYVSKINLEILLEEIKWAQDYVRGKYDN